MRRGWSVGPYYYSLTRRRLTPLVVARMAIEVWRVSANLLRRSWRIRATHILLPDFLVVLRNAPALVWLRAWVRTIVRLGNAPSPGRFYGRLWRCKVNPLVDRFVANSDYAPRVLLAHGISPEKVTVIPNMPGRRRRSVESAGGAFPGV